MTETKSGRARNAIHRSTASMASGYEPVESLTETCRFESCLADPTWYNSSMAKKYELHECLSPKCSKMTTNQMYCSRPCSNVGSPRREKVNPRKFCSTCGKERSHTVMSDVCVECTHNPTYVVSKLKTQTHSPDKFFLRDIGLLEWKCYLCGLTEWHGAVGNDAPLQLDHIDGNKHNNTISNLRILCANCHMKTDTYAGKNRNAYVSRGDLTRRYKRENGIA